LQTRIPIDGTIKLAAQLIIHARGRQDFDLIVNFVDALDPFHDTFRIAFQGRPRDLSRENDGGPIHFVRETIEYAEVGQHDELVAHFFLNSLRGFVGGWSLLRKGGLGCQDGSKRDEANPEFHLISFLS
jgi:hypothetical protein